MTPDQKAAFIRAQTEMMVNERTAMLAANAERERAGYAAAYGEPQFDELNARWMPILGYNALLEFFRE